MAGTFADETSDTKLQLLTSVTKQRMRQLGNPMLASLHRYVVELVSPPSRHIRSLFSCDASVKSRRMREQRQGELKPMRSPRTSV